MRAIVSLIRSLSFIALLIGLAFKILHWPGAEIMIASALVVFVGATVMRFLLRR